MATLYSVQGIGVHAEVATCRVNVAYLGQPLVASRSFAFGFLWEGWHHFGAGCGWGLYAAWPGGTEAEARHLAATSGWAATLTGYDWYGSHDTDPRFGEFVAGVEIVEIDDAGNNQDYLSDGRAEDETWVPPTPYAVYRVTATDARWVDWLRAGMAWDTVAYPIESQARHAEPGTAADGGG